MPEISRFLGIVIAMYYRDHAPAHFHAVYGDHEITVEIATCAVNGSFPGRAMAHVQEWRALHRQGVVGYLGPGACEQAPAEDRTAGLAMLPRIVEARYVARKVIWLRFADGAEGEVDLAAELDGEVFEPLKDDSYFKLVKLDPVLHTIVWPNGADFAPEFLRSSLRVAA